MYINSTWIKCITPAEDTHLGGGVTVQVSNNGADYTSSKAAFTYMPAFQIVSIEPTSGPITGGTVLKLFGENFIDDIRSLS